MVKNQYEVDVLKHTLSFSHKYKWKAEVVDYTDYDHQPMPGKAEFIFTEEKAQDAIHQFADCKGVVIHNFSSGHSPGGGVRKGSKAQEEDLCRSSNLLLGLESFPEYYQDNKNYLDGNECYDKMIYSEVVFFKDGKYNLIKNPMNVGVITYMAPCIRRGVTHERGAAIIERRLRHIIHCANAVEAEVLVTGAWGCGAYGNNPETVADIYYNILSEGTGAIKKVVFAVYGDPTNQKVFRALTERLQAKGD